MSKGSRNDARHRPLKLGAPRGEPGFCLPRSKDADMDIPMDLAEVSTRVKEKRGIFKEYNFGPLKDDA